MKVKSCAADCISGYMDFGVGKTSLACCNTDKCNAQDAPGIVLYGPNAIKELSPTHILHLTLNGNEVRCYILNRR